MNLRVFYANLILFLSLPIVFAQSGEPEHNVSQAAPVEVMILATYHMANPDQDALNVDVDDVLTSKRQRELERLARHLERFKPTKIAVEKNALGPRFVWKEKLDREDLTIQRNEVYQVGERVALGCGLDKLYGIDSDGKFDFAPIQSLDEAQTGGLRLKVFDHEMRQFAQEGERKQHTLPIEDSIAWFNSPDAIRLNSAFYWKILSISDSDSQPAVTLNTEWFERNLQIFGKLLQIAKPGDRVLLLFGQGHAFWLRTFVEQMPGYRLVDPLQYLEFRRPLTPRQAH